MSWARSINHAVYSATGYKLIRKSSVERRAIYSMETLAAEQLRHRIITIGRLLRPERVIGHKKVRVGSRCDGGYVMLDDLTKATHALSLGISDDQSWDVDISQRGITVHQFDHTVDAPPRLPGLHFHKKKIVPTRDADGESIESIANSLGLKQSASTLLKLDIEEWEWPVFDDCDPDILALFSQIVGEFHHFSAIVDKATYDRYHRALTKLLKQFAVVHVHANNCGPMFMLGGVPFPDALELTLVNRSIYQTEPSNEIFPTELDAANNPDAADYFLGSFVF